MFKPHRFDLQLLLLLLPLGIASAQSESSAGQTASLPIPNATPEITAQHQAAPAYESSTVLKATTRLVVVDVIATDGQGHAVSNLTAADFKLIENGKEQKISVFNLQTPRVRPLPVANASATPMPTRSLPNNVFTNVPHYRADAPLNVILLDGLNTSLPSQSWVRGRMLEFLEKLPADRPIAIYTMGSQLQLLQDFTTDPNALKAAIRALKTKSSPVVRNDLGGATEIMPASAFSDMADSNGVAAGIQERILRFEAEDAAHETDFRVQYTVEVLRTLATSLAAYPGRKNLIWVSEGFPINLNAGDPVNERRQGGALHYSYEIARTADALETAQVSVYTVYAGGLTMDPLFDARVSGNTQVASTPDVLDNYATMHEIADRTGGLFFHNENNLDLAIKESIEDGSTYYTLGYYPEDKNWTGEFRKLKVTSRPGVKLRYRSGYMAVNPDAFQKETEKQQAHEFSRFLDLNFPVATGLLFEAAVLPPSEKTDKVLVNFLIDPRALRFENQSDASQGSGSTQLAKVECVVKAYSASGQPINTAGHTINAPLSSEALAHVMKTGFLCQQTVDLPPGDYVLRLGVRDNQSGLIGTANARLSFSQNPALNKKQDTQKIQPN